MGCGGSKPQQEGSVNGSDATAKARNVWSLLVCAVKAAQIDSQEQASIDKQLRADKQAEARIIKMLLLGAGESGKSTVRSLIECERARADFWVQVIKQMR